MTDTQTEKAVFLMKAAGIYERRSRMLYDHALRAERSWQLNALGLLSTQAIAAILGCSTRQVIIDLCGTHSKVRGTLNPKHLGVLGYALSSGKLTTSTLQMLIDGGTSVPTIARLTDIPERSLWRQKVLINN